MLKNMQQLGEVCYVTLVSDDDEKIRAHKLVLASVSTPSGTCSRLMTKIQHKLWINPYERSIKKIYIYLVDLVYNGESTVKERGCEDFLKILKKYNILKVKSTGKLIKYCIVFRNEKLHAVTSNFSGLRANFFHKI